MPRGDVQIDFETNDLKIEKFKLNKYVKSSWEYNASNNTVTVSVEVPRQYADGSVPSLDWKSYVAPVRFLEEITGANDTSEVRLYFYYVDLNGLSVPISNLQLANENSEYSLRYLDVQNYNELISGKREEEEYVFNYRIDASTGWEYFVMNVLVLGDFVVENSVNQNEYVLLNGNEGSFLQNPTFCVGAKNYIQAPTNDEGFLQTIVEKFAQDSLRVLGIARINDVIELQSEEFNNRK